MADATTKSGTARLEDIDIMTDWGPSMRNYQRVPSVISYSPSPSCETSPHWGYDLSPDALAIVNTKLELDVADTKLEGLKNIIQLLDDTVNLNFDYIKTKKSQQFPWKPPEEIVTDYLHAVFQVIRRRLSEQFTTELMKTVPVDGSVAVPQASSFICEPLLTFN